MTEYERLAACKGCGRNWTGSRACHCTTCHLTFISADVFDAHRVGEFEPDTRRCLTEVEFRQLGFGPNDRGYWHQVAVLQEVIKL